MSTILYFAAIIVAIISLILSANVNGKFKKYSRKPNRRNITGAQVAENMLRQAGICDVSIGMSSGHLSDHYDPRNKTVNLSPDVYDGNSIASVAVAAHECGHAIQHHQGYFAVSMRSALFPVANLGSRAGIYLFGLGVMLSFFGISIPFLLDIGIILFTFAVLFHVVTLPVEFNASKRALVTLKNTGVLYEDEMPGARKVLTAAALTYVAATAAAIIQLLRLIAIKNRD